MSDSARLVLVDGSGYIFRAYHALPPLTRKDGTPVGAVYGFTNMMIKLRESYADDHLVVIFDASRISFRQTIYPEYKAHRPPAPEDLVPQFALVREATIALGIPAIELADYEADDLIASYAEAAKKQGMETLIISSDKDLMQLITDGVKMRDPMKQKDIGLDVVMEKFGVAPEKMTEVQALIGDSVDNVPGVPGIGPKTAAELINQFGTLENLLANLDQIKQPKRRESLQTHAEAARISRQLVELKKDVPLPEPIDDLHAKPLDLDVLLAFLTEQNFTTLIKKFGGDPSAVQSTTVATEPYKTKAMQPVVEIKYETIRDAATLKKWVDEAIAAGLVAVDTETTSLNAASAELVGISLATAAGKAAYIPLAHVEGEAAKAQDDMFSSAPKRRLVDGQIPRDEALKILEPLFTHAGTLKVGHNLKYDLVVLDKYKVRIAPVGDTMLMSYAIGAGLHAHNLDELAQNYCGHKMISFDEVTGTGKARKTFDEVDIDSATKYAAEDADFTLRLYHALLPQLVEKQVMGVYETIDRPLIPIITAMEATGITIDKNKLNELSRYLAEHMATLDEDVQKLAGMPFSIGSPKQLGEVLFDKLQLEGGKKSAKSGAYTTDAETLEILAADGHEIAQKVLDWRHMSKLKSTYTDALPEAINARTGRVHTSYGLASTTTGRLSSTDPNLQNIPIRTELGRQIRDAFIAAPNHSLISADYSQIELRLLAHVANIDVLKEAFIKNIDIHAVTASQMFGVKVEEVTGDLRRSAKTINFGIIYGISAHGLAARLGISRTEAGEYIDKYFKQYPGIREYMDTTIAFARTHGYVQTLDGRKVHVKGINDKNPNMRNFSERAAINAPLQGTAADIIKRAMVGVYELCAQSQAKLLLQVHDELVIEAPANTAESLANEVKRTMERAANLSVPLTVEMGTGQNWGKIH
ncbi:MAG: DNA polymerase I [Alphaproteobacteria bacterium]|nr:DNA polymerase I [Alphaproteobacteria bacterium]